MPPYEVEKLTCVVSQFLNKFQPTDQELRERYEEQQRRLACPSCGEEPFID